MAFHDWLIFVAAYGLLCLTPGPSVLLVIAQTITHGRGAGLRTIAGDLLGGALSRTLSLLGLGALMASSALAFAVIKWAGVGYLLWLGARQLRAQPQASPRPVAATRAGFLTGVLNPKAVVFFIAFTAQFLDPARPLWLQGAILILTATLVAGGVLTGYMLLAGRLRPALSRPLWRRRSARASGALMMGGGLLLASTQR
ncbi:MAG: lysine transporter LysE [Rhodobacterales bacterium]|nr:MAG: lysine transporter LysE [Rhodobacterales bacterium]